MWRSLEMDFEPVYTQWALKPPKLSLSISYSLEKYLVSCTYSPRPRYSRFNTCFKDLWWQSKSIPIVICILWFIELMIAIQCSFLEPIEMIVMIWNPAADQASVESEIPACFKDAAHSLSRFTSNSGTIVVMCTLLHICKTYTVIALPEIILLLSSFKQE